MVLVVADLSGGRVILSRGKGEPGAKGSRSPRRAWGGPVGAGGGKGRARGGGERGGGGRGRRGAQPARHRASERTSRGGGESRSGGPGGRAGERTSGRRAAISARGTKERAQRAQRTAARAERPEWRRPRHPCGAPAGSPTREGAAWTRGLGRGGARPPDGYHPPRRRAALRSRAPHPLQPPPGRRRPMSTDLKVCGGRAGAEPPRCRSTR